MRKKEFYSELFRKKIYPTDPDFIPKAYAELSFRISVLEKSKCSCFQCQSDLTKYKTYMEKHPNPFQW